MVDPLTPKSDSHLISPDSVTSEININVKRIKEMIANWRNSWLFDKFSLLIPREMCSGKCGEYAYWS